MICPTAFISSGEQLLMILLQLHATVGLSGRVFLRIWTLSKVSCTQERAGFWSSSRKSVKRRGLNLSRSGITGFLVIISISQNQIFTWFPLIMSVVRQRQPESGIYSLNSRKKRPL